MEAKNLLISQFFFRYSAMPIMPENDILIFFFQTLYTYFRTVLIMDNNQQIAELIKLFRNGRISCFTT